MKRVMNVVLRPVAGLFAVALLFTACKKLSPDYQPNPSAGLMAFNLAPDKSAVAFTLSGNILGNAPLAYSSYTGVYLPIFVGTREVRTVDYNTGSTLALATGDFADSNYYSAFLLGGNGNYRNVVVKDELNSLTAASGKAWVRYINAIADSASSPLVTIGTGGENTVNENAPYAKVSGFVQVNSGAVNTAVNNGGNIAASRTITLEENKAYTVLFSGLPNQTDSSKAVQVRFIQNGTITP
jgi:hypothetical protein